MDIFTQSTKKMKAIVKQIDTLIEQIESGIYTKPQAMFKIRGLKYLVEEKYEIDSDEHTACLHLLLEAHELAQNL